MKMKMLSRSIHFCVLLNGVLVSQAFSPPSTARVAAKTVGFKKGVAARQSPLPAAADDGENLAEENDSEDAAPPSPPAPVSNPVTPVRRMDPLVASLTRSDPPREGNKINNPTVNVPLGGEVKLDQTLFVLLPVVLFAVLGGLLSIYVALNSGDALSQAWNVYETALNAPAGTVITDPDACRGICSSQDADLEALETFMNGLKK